MMEPRTLPMMADVEPQRLRAMTEAKLKETRESLERALSQPAAKSLREAGRAALHDVEREERWRGELRPWPTRIELHALDDFELLEEARQFLLMAEGPLNRSVRRRFAEMQAEWNFRRAGSDLVDAVRSAVQGDALGGRLPQTQKVRAALARTSKRVSRSLPRPESKRTR